jgi:hypothetical protein
MNLISECYKDETATVRRMSDGYHQKSSSEKWMPRIDHFNLIECLDRSNGLAQTCSIKMCALSTACPYLLMPSAMQGVITRRYSPTAAGLGLTREDVGFAI